ncbi:MAG: sugar transferase [Gammaproteobacteria bacterium]|nr:sugar transferase [Gammaproteobacteria bacterium]
MIVKRLFDIILSLFLLIVFSPILLITALLVRIKLGSPVLFQQVRPGLNEKLFTVKKFRTMTNAKNNDGVLLSDAERLTKFGKFLRSTSLDELPQLLNVLTGDMSFVGPRPLLVAYLSLYNAEQKRRHDVRPGITGWAQVNGRNNLLWEEKFKCDVWYVERQSFFLDLKILFLTFLTVIKRSDISNNNHVTAPPFMGCNQEANNEGV